MASSLTVTAHVSLSVFIFVYTNLLSAVDLLTVMEDKGVFFSFYSEVSACPMYCIWEAAHCFNYSLKTPLNESFCTLHFNLIITLSFHNHGNYSPDTSNSGFLSKYLQCSVDTFILQTALSADFMSCA